MFWNPIETTQEFANNRMQKVFFVYVASKCFRMFKIIRTHAQCIEGKNLILSLKIHSSRRPDFMIIIIDIALLLSCEAFAGL